MSVVGPVLRLQASTPAPPAVHAVVPAEQMPCLPVLQPRPPPGLPLSIEPLQSLSLPSQTSATKQAPPQSTPVSLPFCTPSEQVAAWQ